MDFNNDSIHPEEEPDTGLSENDALMPVTSLEQAALEGIFKLLFKATRVDFSHYRKNTVLRRLVRRMTLCKQNSFVEYLHLLENNKDETRLLYDDLLLSYTEFFREPNVFDALKKQVFASLVGHCSTKEAIRIWVPGCSTGEEVYSLAICFQEFLRESNSNLNLKPQFFGTDLNARHIDVARTALYPEKIRKNLSSAQVGQYFDQTRQGLKVTKYIREMCIFAVQNILQDPPFSNIDLISCRNVLIYFDAAFQETVIPFFHFSLRTGGFLLLGSSESMGRFPDLFTLVDQKINLYSKRFSPAKSAYYFAANQHALRSREEGNHIPAAISGKGGHVDINKQIDTILLDAFAPPCVLVDSSLIIRQFRGKVFPFFEPVTGEASLKLSRIVGDSLMPELYVAIEEARKKHCKIKKKAVTFKRAESILAVDISIFPVQDHSLGELCFLILFEKSDVSFTAENNDSLPADNQDDELRRLRAEIHTIKEYLQSIIEEKDEVNQELWAANEEVQSTNEELQSINEELEAAKEELESSNEELIALNEELQVKNCELKLAKDFSENILETAKAIIVLLDAKGRILMLNSYAEKLTGYRRDEVIGRNWFETFIPLQQRNTLDIVFKDVLERLPDALQFENTIMTKSGAERLIRWSNSVLRDNSGAINGALSIGMDVTDHRQAERALKESEAKYRNLVETSQDLIWQCDSKGRYTYLNPAWETTLGYTIEGMLGRKCTDFLSPKIVEKESEEIDKVFKGGMTKGYETIYIGKDGNEINLVLNAVAVRTETGDIMGIRGTAHDVTGWKKAEQKYQILFNQMLDGFALHEIINDEQGIPVDYRFLTVNPAFEELTGLKAADIIGKTVLEVLPGTERSWIETYGNVANSGEPVSFENYAAVLQKYFTVTAFCFAPGQFACIFMDITDRKRMEEALQESIERFDQLAKQTRTFLWEVNADGLITFVSPVVQQVLGYTPEEIVDRMYFYDFHPLSGREALKSAVFSSFKRQEQLIDLHNPALTKDGQQVWLSTYGAPLLNQKGEVIGYQGGDTDITDRKNADEIRQGLEQHQQQVQRLESLSMLAGGIAHDFNNLLGGIFAFIDLAIEESKNNLKASHYLKTVLMTIDRARALTQQLLTFAKGGAPVQVIDSLFPSIQETAQFALSGSNISCRYDIQRDLRLCNFDKNQICQVIENLIINAQQAMPTGGTIELTARNISFKANSHPTLPKGEYVKISIKDYGIGIPVEMISRIFDPFFTTKAKGHGLGLATCYSIINRHGGCIDVESQPGKGSTFHVFLPTVNESMLPVAEEVPLKHAGAGIFLVMDDEDAIRKAIEAMLISFGYTVVCKETGKDALDFFEEARHKGILITGIIFDLTIPGGIGGKEVISEIRKLDGKIPVFVVSGYAEDPVIANPTQYGFTASISKPFRIAELSKLLNIYMKSY